MTHIRKSGLRRLLDQPHTLTAGQRDHLQDCERCRAAFSEVVAAAGKAASLLESSPRPAVDAPAALAGLRETGLGPVAATSRRRLGVGWHGPRRLMGRPLLGVALASLLALTLVGTGVAGDLIRIFEPEQVVAVQVDPSTLGALPDLVNYGTLSGITEPELLDVGDLAAAAEATGLDLWTPAQEPLGPGPASLFAVSTGRLAFTFDAAKAAAAVPGGLPPLPDELDGSTLFFEGGPAVVQVFGSDPGSVQDWSGVRGEGDLPGLLAAAPDLMIVQMKAPVLSSSGPSVEDYRRALLDLPGIPAELAEQIRAIGNPSATLPLPVPVDLAQSHEVEIAGTTGLAVGDNTGFGSAVVWQSGGVVRAVAGRMAEDEVLAIARSMS